MVREGLLAFLFSLSPALLNYIYKYTDYCYCAYDYGCCYYGK